VTELLGVSLPGKAKPVDGVSILPLLEGRWESRPEPIGFWHPHNGVLSNDSVAWIDNRYKLHKRGEGDYRLFDLKEDISEENDIASSQPDIVKRMKADMEKWQASVKRSKEGEDYSSRKQS
jgi:hypothetical protein